ncbi:hypothetical protein BW737_002285 [Actinomyces ruminis]|uniref:Glycosyl hydrolase family 13 catalytic domain-containing protein n=1 Tax=Actinomyces ruminis TaxID=1937003 RepID=A0ABX4MDE4_9ACTO|nr:hypothetical protein BW737_002285 [Actinomyces ruminis]
MRNGDVIPEALNDVTLYHNRGDSTWTGESTTMGDFQGLDDLMTENPIVEQTFEDIYTAWMDFGVDGFRIDTVKHVNYEFWQAWTAAIDAHAEATNPDFFTFGEVYDATPPRPAPTCAAPAWTPPSTSPSRPPPRASPRAGRRRTSAPSSPPTTTTRPLTPASTPSPPSWATTTWVASATCWAVAPAARNCSPAPSWPTR